jgi:phosphoenolpyruvate synthase/pyruvate phosphate dikinase
MNSIFALDEIRLRDVALVGKEAAALGELRKLGAPVSSAFVIPVAAYAEYISQPVVRSLLEGVASLDCEGIESRLLSIPLPAIFERSVRSSYRDLSGPRDIFVHVRVGDGEIKILGEEELIYTVKAVWAKHIAETVLAGDNPGRNPLPLIIQQVEQCDVGGRLFTSDPHASRAEMAIVTVEYNGGSETFFIDKHSGRLTKRLSAGAIAAPIAAEQIFPLASWASRIEALFAHPQELRWGMSQGAVSFMQITPIYLQPRSSVATKVWSRLGVGDIVPTDAAGLVVADPEQAVSLSRDFPDKSVLLELNEIAGDVLAVIRQAKHRDRQRNLHLIFPPVRTVDALRKMKRNIAGEGLSRGPALKLYLPLSFPANIVLLDKFLEVEVDGVTVDALQLARGFLGVAESLDCAEFQGSVLWAVNEVLGTCRKSGVDLLCCGRGLSEESIKELVRSGVTQMIADACELQCLLPALSQVEGNLLTRQRGKGVRADV